MKNKTTESKSRTVQSSACYAKDDMRLYLQDKMSEDITDAFETHCEICDKCAAALWQQKQSDFARINSDGDKELCKAIENKIRARLTPVDIYKEFKMPRGMK